MVLLHDRIATIHDARHLLKAFVRKGTQHWIDYLTGAGDSSFL